MKNALLISIFIFCGSPAQATDYAILVNFGDKKTNYDLKLDEKSGEAKMRGDSERSLTLKEKDVSFLNGRLADIFKEKSNDQSLCNDRYIAILDKTKNDARLACINSTTPVAKKSTLFVNSLNAALKFITRK